MKSLYRFCCFCFLLSTLMVSDSADTITTNQPLADGKTIISSGGTFELGFYRPDVNSNRTYLGLWYKKVSKVTVVWTANRDVPINDTNGLLKLTDQANLTLFNGEGTAIWSSNASGSAKNPVAQLLDSGNLVVKDAADNNPENYLWQSFEHPTDTLLPGMKLGENLVKGTEVYMQSLKSNVDPSRGNFIFRVDPDGFPQQFLMNGSIPLFRTGPWNGLRFSWGSPGLQPNPLYTYEFVNNPREIYYRYDLINTSVYSRLIVSTDGIIKRFTWNYKTQDWGVYLNAPADTCDTYGLCNNYSICSTANSPICSCLDKFVPKSPSEWQATDWSNGCQRRVPLDCQKGDGFIKYSGIKLPDTRWSWYNRNMTLKECEAICLKNCSCTAYANTDITGKGSGCVLWFGDLIDMTRVNGGQDIYIRMAASEIPSGANKAKILGISLPLVGAFLLLVLSLILCARKKKRRQRKLAEQIPSEWKMESRSEQRLNTESDKEDLDLPLFDLKTIEQATNNFSIDNKLGEGGFGPVYKGTLEEGQEIAVKRLSEYSIQGLDEFKNEVKCIAELQHRNLVKLLGCCIEGEEKMLIYEFMPNKSLDFFLFDNDRSRLLDWPKRYQIIIGIARGLLYLHQDSRLTIIHRDLKAGNILLDSAMKPKISDFGMARIFGGTETEASTKRVVGTYGYMSPEYAVDGVFSTKSDVFSFGVLVLEIVTGKKNRGFSHPDHHHNLLGHAWLLFKDGRFQELIDDHFSQSYCLSEVIRSIHVGLLCVQQYPDDRPSMSSVVLMLVGDGELPFPKEPGYFTERDCFFETDKIFSSGNVVDSSGNQLSITLLEAR